MSVNSDAGHSVTLWIGQLKSGNPDVSQRLWERYVERLLALVRRKLASDVRRAADEQDVVQEAFESFFRAAQKGRFPRLLDREDLWQLLVKITDNKIRDQTKQARRKKRGAGRVLGESHFAGPESDSPAGLDCLPAATPTPDFAAATIEQCRRLLILLADDQLERVALWKLQGFSHKEVAERLGCTADTVTRKVRQIRIRWSQSA